MSIVPLYPQVQYSETDKSDFVAATGSKVGAYAANMSWGALDTVMYLAGMENMLSTCGVPTSRKASTTNQLGTPENKENITEYDLIEDYFKYASSMYLVRVVPESARNMMIWESGSAGSQYIRIGNAEDYQNTVIPSSAMFVGKYPGTLYKNHKVNIYTYAGIAVNDAVNKGYGINLTTKSTLASKGSSSTGASIVLHIDDYKSSGYVARIGDYVCIKQGTGKFACSGNKLLSKVNSVVKDEQTGSYTLTLSSEIIGETVVIGDLLVFHDGYVENLTDPSSILYRLVSPQSVISESLVLTIEEFANGINKQSAVLWSNPEYNYTTKLNDTLTLSLSFDIGGANDGVTEWDNCTDMDYISAYKIFEDKTAYIIDNVITGIMGISGQKYAIETLAGNRRDCNVFLTPPYSAAVNNKGREVDAILEWRNQMGGSRYGFIECSWKQITSTFDNEKRWIPTNASIAGLNTMYDPWQAIAGKNRGYIKNCEKLSWTPNNTQYGVLFQKGINAIRPSGGTGFYLMGDKTTYNKDSAMDALSVGNTLNYIERAIVTFSESVLFENNTASTQQAFWNKNNQFLGGVEGQEGITDYYIKCDDTINTAAVKDNKMFKARIGIKPSPVIRFIDLEFVIMAQGATVSEV